MCVEDGVALETHKAKKPHFLNLHGSFQLESVMIYHCGGVRGINTYFRGNGKAIVLAILIYVAKHATVERGIVRTIDCISSCRYQNVVHGTRFRTSKKQHPQIWGIIADTKGIQVKRGIPNCPAADSLIHNGKQLGQD